MQPTLFLAIPLGFLLQAHSGVAIMEMNIPSQLDGADEHFHAVHNGRKTI